MSDDTLGLSIQAKENKGARTSDRSAYIRYVVAKADGTEGKDFPSFKKACEFYSRKGYLPKGYADDVRTGRRDSGDVAVLIKAIHEKLDDGALELVSGEAMTTEVKALIKKQNAERAAKAASEAAKKAAEQ